MSFYYELEKVRFYRYKGDKSTWIAESQDLQFLTILADDVKLRQGKTFEEKVRISKVEFDTEDILDYPYLRYIGDK